MTEINALKLIGLESRWHGRLFSEGRRSGSSFTGWKPEKRADSTDVSRVDVNPLHMVRNHPLDPKGPRRLLCFQISRSTDRSAELGRVAGTDGGRGKDPT